MQVFGQSEYDGALRNEVNQPDVAPMTGLQITMSREIGGWPLYTIVIGLGQVGYIFFYSHYLFVLKPFADVECYQFPDHFVDGSQLAR